MFTKTRFKLFINLLLAAVIGIASASCDLFPEHNDSFKGDPQVEFYPLTQSVSGDSLLNIKAQLIGKQRSSDLPITVNVVDSSTTAVQGAQYTLNSTSITIPADSSSAVFTINYSSSSIQDDTPKVLVLELVGSDQVKAAPNLKTFTLTINP